MRKSYQKRSDLVGGTVPRVDLVAVRAGQVGVVALAYQPSGSSQVGPPLATWLNMSGFWMSATDVKC